MDRWQEIAMGVGISFGVLLLIGLVAAIFVWNRECRGDRKDAGKEIDEEGAQTPPPEMAQNPAVLPGGTLPVIQERPEEPPEINTHAPARAPQLPDLGTQVARPVTPPEMELSNRASIAPSPVSEDHAGHARNSAAVSEDGETALRSPKGKGKEEDHPVGES
ncbi:hypothetical protein VTI74DRAFT_10949 [Chaetomium olivicolor]